ncbi:MAG: OmpH family outer membrane protein [Cyclobacteriaceae bacterium]|nr:OmpH family outer membrane protein [Cyclobacteriaceae bacterium]
MKTNFFWVAALLFMAFAANAQTTPLKIAYADVDYIFSRMPEAKQIESQLQAHQNKLEEQYKAKVAEYQQKFQALQNMPADTPEAIQQDKMNELAQMEQNIQQFQQNAQSSIAKKREDLLTPVYTKVGDSIKAVAVEKGYDFVLTAGVGGTDIVLYADEKHDISALILAKMGVSGSN